MSWRKISLPDYETVLKWDTKNVLQWLQKNGLQDFSEYVTKSSLTGEQLLEFGETEILFHQDLVDINVTKKTQLAKCVKECKNQASHAKKQISKCISECKVQANNCKKAVNKSLKSKKEKISEQQTSSNGEQDSDHSDNGWNTDFDNSDEEDDEEPESPISEEGSPDKQASNGHWQQSTPKQNGVSKIGSYNMQVQNQDFNSNEIPQNSPMVVLKQIKRYPDALGNDDIPKEMPPQRPRILPKPNVEIPQPPATAFNELQKGINFALGPTGYAPPPLRGRPKAEPPAPPTQHLPLNLPPAPLPPPTTPYNIDDEYETPIAVFHPETPLSGQYRAYPVFPPSSNSSTSDSQDLSDRYEAISNPDDSGTGSLDTLNNDNQEIKRKASLLANEIRSTRTNSNNFPSPNHQMPAAGPANVDNYLTPPLPTKSKPLKSSSSINILQNKLASLKLPGKSNNQASKPLPPKPTDYVSRVPSIPDANLQPLTINVRRALPPEPRLEPNREMALERQPYFHEIERDKAEQAVLGLRQDGAFLVRPSQKGGANNPFTLTLVQSGKAFHLNIRNNKGKYALGKEKPNEKVFDTIPDMISYHRNTAIYVTSQDFRGQECYLKIHPQKHTY